MRVGQYRVPGDVASRVHAGHPWVYREAMGPRGIAEETGAVIDLIAGNREFLARGYVDREHAIAVRILSRDPGEELRPGKGAIALGRDADLVAFDDTARFTVDPARLEHRHPVTPYAGQTLTGVVRRTWLRGRAAGAAPAGRLLTRQ